MVAGILSLIVGFALAERAVPHAGEIAQTAGAEEVDVFPSAH